MVKRQNTSIRVDADLWKRFKVWCVQNDKVMSEVLEDSILRIVVEGDESLNEFLEKYAQELRNKKLLIDPSLALNSLKGNK